jgi:radical SAM protein with 4Fe4S-binding SPASM domain
MEEKRIVPKLYPFLGIARSLLFDKEASLLRCGGGWINYAIQTDGFIIPCPTMWGIKNYYLGHISNADPLKLKKILVNKPCTDCDILNVCGGRCLYANITKRWNSDAYATVCSTVKALTNTIEAQLPRIKQLIKNGKVSQQDFEFMKYNGCEIIP